MPFNVYLAHAPDYQDKRFRRALGELLQASGFAPAPGTRVLVKPNLVAPFRGALTCTHKEVVAGACEYLLELGAKPVVGDSPAFGPAPVTASYTGISQALANLPVKTVNLKNGRPVALSRGGFIKVSELALECDAILNLPKLKAHGQTRLTCAVKNLFGCVPGFRKSLAHQRLGDKAGEFEAMILDVALSLPKVFTLLDAVTAMHVDGPAGGEPYPLKLLAAADNPVALDTAIYSLLGLGPDKVKLYELAQKRGLPGSQLSEISYPLAKPEEFDSSGFKLPEQLSPISFKPLRFVRGRLKSLLTWLKK